MDFFVARQPIFDMSKKVVCYEILFRSSFENIFNSKNLDMATIKVVDVSFLLMGIKSLTGGKMALINFTGELIKEELPALFPAEFMGIEILESITCDPAVIKSCKKLKKRGYTLLLDDFCFQEDLLPLVEIADIIKVDFLTTTEEERCQIISQLNTRLGIQFLAERVETQEQFNEALDLGYQLFQGNFFCEPIIVQGREIPRHQLNNLRILQEVNQKETSFERITELIKTEVSIPYKLLKLVNSGAFGLQQRVFSLKYALIILGLKNVKKLVNVICLNNIGHNKPRELLVRSLFRARFCELLAPCWQLPDRDQELFLLGLFSTLDVFFHQPMGEILDELPLHPEIKATLLGEETIFSQIYSLILSYEKGEWEEVDTYLTMLGADSCKVPSLYQRSIDWINAIFQVFNGD